MATGNRPASVHVETPEAVTQLRAAIDKSGLNASAYARHILIRSPRTVRRWLAGDSPIPEAVRDFLNEGR